MSNILETLTAMKRVRVAVLGDIMLDRFVMGETERISPEAPIPVIRVVQEQAMLGGAGNVARNITSMGGQVHLVGLVGADDAAREVEAAVAGIGGLSASLVRDANRCTTLKTRYIAQGQQLVRVDREATVPATGAIADELLSAARLAIGSASLVVLSDYAKGVLSPELVANVMAIASRSGCPVIVDPKQRDMRCYAGATVITPNAAEATAATGIDCSTEDGVVAAARRIGEVAGCRYVLVTRGAKGMTLVEMASEASIVHLPARLREVHDVSGAGDTAIAALALALGAQAPIAIAADLANIAAGIAVSHRGTAAVTATEIEAAAQDKSGSSSLAKIVSCERAVDMTRRWRSEGRRVVLTNGCFDLLHPGHVHLLQQAKDEGDRLVVALNSDASVRRLKGPARPIQTQEARAFVIASMAAVDLVLLFDEDTPLAIVEAICPDVLVKGADYTESQVVGAERVRASGGRIVLVPLIAGHSTSAAIARAVRLDVANVN
jgi:D-beta-D-heptose 7-phosphate kinase/D-beta-D-heptose 1-phosphate adenosyltransferase